MARKSAWIRELIDENKYVEALEMIDKMSLEDVESTEDLNLFADLYEKAERLEKKKEIYYIIYERNHSRHVLNRLLRLVLRLGEMEEARELFLAYEMTGEVTLDTYELRYLLAKAEGASRQVLIDILQELKKEEYTEKWGYQLARLYEQEGMRSECIQECRDLKLWFGEGEIVQKADELRARCEREDWQPPTDEEIPEVEMSETPDRIAFAAPQVPVTDLEDEAEPLSEETEESEAEVSRTDESEPEAPLVGEMASESEPDIKIRVKKPRKKSSKEAEPPKVPEPEAPIAEEMASEPRPEVEVKVQEQREKAAESAPLDQLDEMPDEDAEDTSQRGISYRTLKGTIHRLKKNKGSAHFVFAGGEERITLAVAKRITKELNNLGSVCARSIVKITADKLNELELRDQMDKLLGGCVLITDAPELSKESVESVIECMKEYGDKIVLMLSGPFDEMDCFLSIYTELADMMEYRVRM